MTKSLRTIEADLKLADVIVYVLDARAPKSCRNPVFDDMFAQKKIIYVLNKADLSDEKLTRAWASTLSTATSTALITNGTASGSASSITSAARSLCAEKIERLKARGVKASIRAMVVGVPNCGKSTLINNLCGAGKTVTGNRPGVTRGKQWVRINDYFEVLDTPGTLYPKLDDQTAAYRLAFIGSIKDEVTEIFELSERLISELGAIDKNIIPSRYKIEIEQDEELEHILEKIARSRGYVLRGGAYDTERAANALIDDFRKGKLGKITLDGNPEL